MRGLIPLLFSILAACAQPQQVHDPSLGVHIGSDGQVYPSVSGGVGPVSVGATTGGGVIGTSFGAIRLSAGF